jgi:hypothetical protein
MNRSPQLTTRQGLSPARQSLVVLLQKVRFGRINSLRIVHGEPDWAAGVRWKRTVKICGDNGEHPAGALPDFVLKREVVAFFDQMTAIGDGEIKNLEVRNGLPFTYEVEGLFAG